MRPISESSGAIEGILPCLALQIMLSASFLRAQGSSDIFNVKDYGATGKKEDIATQAIQKAIDACAKSGGGEVYLPAGDYTSGTLHLRSHVKFYLEIGATFSDRSQSPISPRTHCYWVRTSKIFPLRAAG